MVNENFIRIAWRRAAFCLGLACLSTPAMAAVEDFVGTWANIGRDTSGITHMVVTRAGLGANIQVFGECQPRDCNWGNARGTVYSSGPDRDPRRAANSITANFSAGFSQKFIVLREARGNQVTVDVYTSFTDRSRRANYMSTVRMRRDRQVAVPPRRGGNQGTPEDWWQQQYGRTYSYNDDVFYQQCRQSPDPAGVIAGALIGGILGHVLGDGRTGATVAGVVVGGVAGAALTQDLSCEDRSYAYRTYYDGLNAGASNRSYDWRNQSSGSYGSFNVGEYYDDPYGFRCATYSQAIYVQGRPQEATGRACRQPDGTWAIVS